MSEVISAPNLSPRRIQLAADHQLVTTAVVDLGTGRCRGVEARLYRQPRTGGDTQPTQAGFRVARPYIRSFAAALIELADAIDAAEAR